MIELQAIDWFLTLKINRSTMQACIQDFFLVPVVNRPPPLSIFISQLQLPIDLCMTRNALKIILWCELSCLILLVAFLNDTDIFPLTWPKVNFFKLKKKISLARPSFVLHYSEVLSISHLKHAKFNALGNDVYLCWNISIMYKSRVESMQILKYYVMYLQEWGLGLGGDSSEPVTWVHHSVVFIVTVLVVGDTPIGFMMFLKNSWCSCRNY